MATMTPREAADFRIRGMIGWGGTLTALGALLLGLAWIAAPDRRSSFPDAGNDVVIFAVLALVALVPGLVLLQVGLVAVGVRIGLRAHGVASVDDAAGA